MITKVLRRCFILSVGLVLYQMLMWHSDSDSVIFSTVPNSLVKLTSIKLQFTDRTFTQSSEVNKVVIGTHFCRVGNFNKENKYYKQTIVMIKSVLLSAKLHSITCVEIHLILDHIEDEKYFREEIEQDMMFPGEMDQQQVIVKLKFYSAVKQVPKKYYSHMIYQARFRCSFLPLFYQKSLLDVDSIIHLNSETIITGNIGMHWKILGKMDNNQMVAFGHSRQPENDKYMKLEALEFTDIPYLPPKGVNSNVAVMNLTRMRNFGYYEKALELFDNYSETLKGLNYEQLVNILLYHNPEIVQILLCHLNFLATDCQRGFFCKSAFDNAEGLHLINGNSLRFMENQVFHPFYKFYSKFNLSDPNANYRMDLVKPIQHAFSNVTNRANNQCYGSVNKVIFRSSIGWLDNILR